MGAGGRQLQAPRGLPRARPAACLRPPFRPAHVPHTRAGFDPLGYSKGDFAGLKQKEIKNGRLAMMAFLGEPERWELADRS